MEFRSRMATLALAAGLLVASRAGAAAQEPTAKAPAAQADPAAHAGTQSVKLRLKIAGLGRSGCDVEVKPGNRGCRFTPQTQHVGALGDLSFQFKDVELRGADRNCTFAITVRETGQPARTIYRGFRVTAQPAQPGAAQTFLCLMNSPSKLADLERTERTRQ